MKKIISILSLTLILVISGCNVADENADNGKMNVYTSFYAMYDFTKQIGGDKINIINLVPSGVEPHDWEPTPNDIAKLSKGDMLIYQGNGMESWVDKVISSISDSGLVLVKTSDEDGEVHNHDVRDDEHNHDPHIWLNPLIAYEQMEKIANKLCEEDPENAVYYKENLNLCKVKITQLDEEYKAAIKNFNSKDIIVAHEAYGYLCEAYGLNQIAVEGIQGDSDPSPARMAEIVDFAKENNVKYIFFENSVDTKVLNTIKNEIGAESLVLNPFELDIDNKDYFDVMEENLVSLKTALK